jgi:hypothetical protein
MATDYNLLGSTEVLEELQQGRTRELLLLLQDRPVPEVQDPLNIQSGLSSDYQTDGDGDYVLGSNTDTATRCADNFSASDSPKSGLKINPNAGLVSITLTISTNPSGFTTAYITDTSGNIISSKDISGLSTGDSFTITESLTSGTSYYVVMDADGASWTRGGCNNFSAPQTSDTVDITAGVYQDTSEVSGNAYNFVSVEGESEYNSAYITDQFAAPTTEPADFKQWNAIRAEDVTTSTRYTSSSSLTEPPFSSIEYYGISGEKIYFYDGGTSTVYIYDIPSDTWSNKSATVPHNGSNGASVAENGNVYGFGGYDGSVINDAIAYDISSNTFNTLTSMPTAVTATACEVYNGKIYVAGGGDGNGVISDLQIYDISSDTWSTGASLPTAVRFGDATEYDGKLYFWAGYDGTNLYDYGVVYDVNANTWSTTSTVTTDNHLSGPAINRSGEAYVYEGTEFKIYDYSADSWSSTSSTNANSEGVGYNDKLYSFAGTGMFVTDFETPTVEFEILDSTDTVINSTRIPKARIADEPFTIRNRVYSESATSDGQSDYQIATTGDGGHFGIPVLTVVSVKKNGSVLDSANWSFDGDTTVTVDTSNVTIESGDTIDIKYDFDVFDSTLKPRAYLNRADTSETSPSISHFRYEYVI